MDYTNLMLSHVAILSMFSSNFVFKGALLLKVLSESDDLYMATSDIDFDFNNTNITQIELDSMISKSCNLLRERGYMIYPICKRQFNVGKSAGYSIISNDIELYHIDISVRNQNSNVNLLLNGTSVKCATIEKMLCDKLSAVSSSAVNRRVKDVYDIYYMSLTFDFNYRSIVDTFLRENRSLEDFTTFLSAYDNLAHAYDLYKGIYLKPEFDIIYASVKEFCMPFYTHKLNGEGDMYWKKDVRQWLC